MMHPLNLDDWIAVRRASWTACCALLMGMTLMGCDAGAPRGAGGGDAAANADLPDQTGDDASPGRPVPAFEIQFVDDVDSSLLAVAADSGGARHRFFGNRDDVGVPTNLTHIVSIGAEGVATTTMLDETGRPVRIERGDENATIIYQADHAVVRYRSGEEDAPSERLVEVALSSDRVSTQRPGVRLQQVDRFAICMLGEMHYGLLDALFPCESEDAPPECESAIPDASRASGQICEASAQLAVVSTLLTDADQDVPATDPVLDVAAEVESTVDGALVHLAASVAGVDPGGAIVWRVTDGPSTPALPQGSPIQALFRVPGEYELEAAYVIDDAEQVVAVLPLVLDPFAPVADAGDDQTVGVGETVVFDGRESADADGVIVLYEWTFGDGSDARGSTAGHVYQQPGSYEATLTVTDDDGQSATDSLTIAVSGTTGARHTITIETVGEGNTTPAAGDSLFAADALVPIIATPADGWRFVRYEGDAAGTNPTTFVIVSADLFVTAVFEPLENATDELVTLDILINPPNSGTVTLDPPGDPAGVYPVGTEVTATAAGEAGFLFTGFAGIVDSNAITETFAVDRSAVLVASFGQGVTFALTTEVQPANGGAIILSPPGGNYAPGSVVNVVAVPNADFAFETFFGASTAVNPITSVTMSGPLNVGATFVSTIEPTQITAQPVPIALGCAGGDAQFGVTASGEALTFAWERDCNADDTFEEAIADNAEFDLLNTNTSSTLTVLAADNGDVCDYRCNVSGTGGDVLSSEVALTIAGSAPMITQQPAPADQTVCPGSDVVYTVAATGQGPLSYQWLLDGADLPGENSDTLTLTGVDGADAGAYSCEVTDDCDTTESDAANLFVQADLQFESGTVVADGGGADVVLTNTYCNPVVVCTIEYVANNTPVVTRVSNVSPTGFHVRLQNPSDGAVAADTVHYLVMEAGAWSLDGVDFEAQFYTSTVTDRAGSFAGQAQAYLQAYANPVVIGQVMSENDAAWSVFWCRGNSATSPPNAGNLFTGKHVGADGNINRADEQIGFIVFESGHAMLAGVAMEANLGADTVRGVDNGAPANYNYDVAFVAAPAVTVASQAAMDGSDGAWAYVTGSTMSQLMLLCDEDQIGDAERSHTTEQVGYVVFESAVVVSP